MTPNVPPKLVEIDPSDYPKPAADYRVESHYEYQGDDPVKWAWEFVRRDPRFQVLTDIKYSTGRAMENNSGWFSEEEDNLLDKLAEMEKRSREIKNTRVPDKLVDELRRFKEFEAQVDHARKKGYFTENHVYSLSFSHVVSRSILLHHYPEFKECAGWQNQNPWHEIPGMSRPDRLNPRVHDINSPPWPISWFGHNLVPEDDIDLNIAYMDATSIESYTYGNTVHLGTQNETSRVLSGNAVGSVVDFGRRKDYKNIIQNDSEKSAQMVHLAFDLSAPLENQIGWARDILNGMMSRGIKAGVIDIASNAEKMPGKNGGNYLRYLDYSYDKDQIKKADFKRMIGVDPSDSSAFRRLKEGAEKYLRLGAKICAGRGPK